MSDEQHDPFDELMRRSLADEAARIEPADGLHRIQARVRADRGLLGRRPWVITVATAVVGTAAAVGAFTMLADGLTDGQRPGSPEVAGPVTTAAGDTTPAPTPSALASTDANPASPTTTPSPSASTRSSRLPSGTPEAVAAKAVPIYWIGRSAANDTGGGYRLFRTFSRIKGQPAYEAVRVMTVGKAEDPDYESPWLGAEVDTVTRSDSVVTVDFKELPRQKLQPALADLAVQQLVYTVQGAMGDDRRPVQITQRGRTGALLFGVVDTRKPTGRAPATAVQALVWITEPANDAVVTSPVRLGGIAAASEAVVNWRAINLKTKVALSGSTMTKEGQKFSPFLTGLRLDPGSWEVQAYLLSMEDGRMTDVDTKIVIVR